MKNYADLIDQTFDFPTKEFKVKDNQLIFNDIDLMGFIEKYGTPMRLTYVPKIAENIRYARKIFQRAIYKLDYQASYHYAYCTKPSHSYKKE